MSRWYRWTGRWVLTWVALWNCFFSPATDITAAAETKHAENRRPVPAWTRRNGGNAAAEGTVRYFSKNPGWDEKGAIGGKKPSGVYFQAEREWWEEERGTQSGEIKGKDRLLTWAFTPMSFGWLTQTGAEPQQNIDRIQEHCRELSIFCYHEDIF